MEGRWSLTQCRSSPWQNGRLGLSALLFLSLLLPAKAGAQMSLGFLGGYNLATFTGSGAVNLRYRTGFLIGATGTFKVSDSFSARPELYLSVKGSALPTGLNGSDDIVEFGVTYIQLPVLLQLHTSSSAKVRPHLFGGLSLGWPLACAFGPVDCQDLPDFRHQRADLGVVVGAEIEIAGMGVGARYEAGVMSLNRRAPAQEVSNSVVSFTVRYLWEIWGGRG